VSRIALLFAKATPNGGRDPNYLFEGAAESRLGCVANFSRDGGYTSTTKLFE